MGMFDTVRFCCPSCNEYTEVQSKAGDCSLREYTLESAPVIVLWDLTEDWQIWCDHCKCKIKIIPSSRPTFKAVKEKDDL
jgi:hypothetical protein